MVTKSSREMQKDREKIRPPFGGLKFCQGTHYLPLTIGKQSLTHFLDLMYTVNHEYPKQKRH